MSFMLLLVSTILSELNHWTLLSCNWNQEIIVLSFGWGGGAVSHFAQGAIILQRVPARCLKLFTLLYLSN